MVTVIANRAIAMDKLPGIALFSDPKNLDLPTIVAQKSFHAQAFGFTFDVDGVGLTIAAGTPVSGTVKMISVAEGSLLYKLGMSLELTDLASTFKGDFEADFFSGNDLVSGSGFVDLLLGYDGSDALSGGEGDDVLRGGAGNDTMRGGIGNDTLRGQDDDDTLNGGYGNNTLFGGGGKNAFVFDLKPRSITFSAIADYQVKNDAIQLDASAFAGVGSEGKLGPDKFVIGVPTTPDQVIVYDQSSGMLFYDADGSGPGKAVAFGSVTSGTALTASEFLVI